MVGLNKEPYIAAREKGPGPGRYVLPSTTGFTSHDVTKRVEPAYTFGHRIPEKDKKVGPGPAYSVDAQFTRTGRDGTPAFSILSRKPELTPLKTPSPYAYYPERVPFLREKTAPKHSLGSRNRYRRVESNPAPSKYMLPHVFGAYQPMNSSAASFSMKGRSKVGCYMEDLAKTPGPGHHTVTSTEIYKGKAPQITLGPRNYMPGDNVKKPGPGTHRPEDVTLTHRAAPVVSLGVRHSEYIAPLII